MEDPTVRAHHDAGAGEQRGDVSQIAVPQDLYAGDLSVDSTGFATCRFVRSYRSGFLDHYHKRSKEESTVSMIEAKVGDAVRGKGYAAQMNKPLCKVLCHNICVVIQSTRSLGIEPVFAGLRSG